MNIKRIIFSSTALVAAVIGAGFGLYKSNSKYNQAMFKSELTQTELLNQLSTVLNERLSDISADYDRKLKENDGKDEKENKNSIRTAYSLELAVAKPNYLFYWSVTEHHPLYAPPGKVKEIAKIIESVATSTDILDKVPNDDTLQFSLVDMQTGKFETVYFHPSTKVTSAEASRPHYFHYQASHK